ncbi:MAG: hypothetical protein ACRDD4_00470 [Culicoidibacterales bacterium]
MYNPHSGPPRTKQDRLEAELMAKPHYDKVHQEYMKELYRTDPRKAAELTRQRRRQAEDKKITNVMKDTFVPGHKAAKIAERKRQDRNATIASVAFKGIGLLAMALLSNKSNK